MDDVVRLAFIGDELTAAGYRLAGAGTYTPDKPQITEAFAKIGQDCDLLLMTAEYARELPQGVLSAALQESEPLVLIVPDVLRQHMPPDLARDVDRALGIES